MENKKIAFIAVWFSLNGSKDISEDNKFILECLYKTAKKKFLLKHDIEFILVTNTEVKIEGVTIIKVDYNLSSISHAQLMKILAIKFLPNIYDYIFVSDADQVYVGEVEENILEEEFVLLNHWGQKINQVHGNTVHAITLDIEEKYKEEEDWTLGCFFGGKSKNVLDLLKLAEEEHLKYYTSDENFYTVYAEETLILKYVYEQKIPAKRLKVTAFPRIDKEGIFLATFNEEAAALLLDNTNNMAKVLHDTKTYIQTLKDKIDLI